MDKSKLILIAAVIALLIGGYFYAAERYDAGYNVGHTDGYNKGYSDGYADRNKLVAKEISDAVVANSKTETKIVYQTIPYNGNDVQVHTEKPVVTVEVNGKKQEVQQHSETADLAVKTETAVKIKVPERRWSVGIGTDGKKPMFMMKAPVKDAIGVWVAGGSHKFMGGLSVSF